MLIEIFPNTELHHPPAPAPLCCSPVSAHIISFYSLLTQQELSLEPLCITICYLLTLQRKALLKLFVWANPVITLQQKHIILDGAGRAAAPEPTAKSSHSRLRDGPGKHLAASLLYTHLIKFSQKSEAEKKKLSGGLGVITSMLKQHKACWRSRWVDS